MTSQLLDSIQKAFPSLKVERNFPLSKISYMKTGGPAELFVTVTSTTELVELVTFLREKSQSWYILGGASNVLIPDVGLPGVVIQNRAQEFEMSWISEMEAEVLAGSGHLTSLFVRKTMDASLTGTEPFLGVPGTIGGAVYNNSHYMNELISDILVEVEVLSSQNERVWKSVSDLKFAYDYSTFQETQELILTAKFRLKKGNPEEIKQIMLKATKKRASSQPLGVPSSGCMFKNIELADGTMISTGKLIDEVGLKGFKIGGAVVSDIHANFIVNDGTATTQNILDLAKHIESVLHDKKQITLEKEVFLISNPRM